MEAFSTLTGWKDKALFTPGPLTTSRAVKQAMLRDLGSRDHEFIALVKDIRDRLLILGQVREPDYTAVIIQGSGTFGIESVISSVIPAHGKLLVVVNGAYGRRMVQMAQVLHIDCVTVVCAENETPQPGMVDAVLESDPAVTHVAIVHCETTTGIMNPVAEIGEVVRLHGASYIVDAMSSFGAVPLDAAACNIDYLISSANKCIEGVPGFSFVIAWRAALEETRGHARSLSLNLLAQWEGLEANGQFRFTPPTHALLAFHQALVELEMEGGVAGRAARYRANHAALLEGMRALGFREYVPPELQGYIITSFYYPIDPKFDFAVFYEHLGGKGFVIYPGKLTQADCFRIGNIGRITGADVQGLLAAIRVTLVEMEVIL